MSGVTRQRGEIRVFRAEGTVSGGREQGANEEQGRVNGSQQRQGGRA